MANSFSSIMGDAMGILKNWYQGPIVSQFNDEIPFYRECEKGKEKYNGLRVIRPIKVRRNPGIGATSDGGTLPAIGTQSVQQAQIEAKFLYLRFGITGPMIKASQGDKGAFVSAMEYEMQEGLNDLTNDVNRQLFWDGTGTLATLSANASATNVITVTGRTDAEPGNKYLDIGMVVDIYTSAGVQQAQGLEITDISGTDTATVTLSGNVTASADDIVVRSGAYDLEISGLRYSLDGGTSSIYNIDRSTYPIFQGNVVNQGGNQMTLDFLQETYNEAKRRGGAKVNAVFSDYDSERFYNKLLIADKRYIGKVKGDGTFSSKDGNYLEFAGVPWVADKDCTQDVYMLDSRHWKKYVLSELEWADETGTYLIAQTSADSFEARLRLFFDFFCEKPSAQARGRNYIAP